MTDKSYMQIITEACNVVSVSGGKDSTATLLRAIEMGTPHLQAVFADTGNEHPATLDYIAYLSDATGVGIRTIRADFADKVIRRREVVRGKWVADGVVTPDEAEAICELLVPTGIPFLDLCIWKGRFPARMAQFCTQELKGIPIMTQVMQPLIDAGHEVVSWQGVRRDESEKRRNAVEWEEKDEHFIYRPIVDWTAQQAIDYHHKHGIQPNPLYSQGMNRVGCMPCINVKKGELHEIARRFPEHVARIAAWEKAVSLVGKRRNSTFFHAGTDPTIASKDNNIITTDSHGIYAIVEWSKTARGGRQFDLLNSLGSPMCSSSYGLCS